MQEAVLGAGVLDRLGHGLHFVEGGRRGGHQVRVVDQGDVLRGLGHAVELAIRVGEGLDGVRGEVGRIGAQFDRGEQTAGVEFADPVMGAQDDVRAAARGGGSDEVVADVAQGLLDHHQLDAGLLRRTLAPSSSRIGARCSSAQMVSATPVSAAGAAALRSVLRGCWGLSGCLGGCGGFGRCFGGGFGGRCRGRGRGAARRGAPPPHAARTSVPISSMANRTNSLLRIRNLLFDATYCDLCYGNVVACELPLGAEESTQANRCESSPACNLIR